MHMLSLCLTLFALTPEVRDGTVIVLENSNRVVEVYTRSEVTHVAMVLHEAGQPWVYEATPREVRKITLAAYYAELGEFNHGRREANQLRVRLYQPAAAYSDQEITAVRCYLDSQLGRRYLLKGYVRGRPNDGVHCAELVSTAITAAGRQRFERTHAISPSNLVAKIEPQHDPPIDVDLPAYQPSGTWCERSQGWWSGLFSWCSWACVESWYMWR